MKGCAPGLILKQTKGNSEMAYKNRRFKMKTKHQTGDYSMSQ